MKTPTPEQMAVAAEWLDVNNGEGDEEAGCKAVAEWLRGRAALADQSTIIKTIAKERGVSPAAVRRVLKQKMKGAGA